MLYGEDLLVVSNAWARPKDMCSERKAVLQKSAYLFCLKMFPLLEIL